MEKWIMEGVYSGYEISVKDNTWPNGSRPIARTTNTGKDVAAFKANAHLIAAAPELLEACKKGLEVIEGEYPADDEVAKPVMDFIRAAINKAEGR